jgi:hypothetical protein
MVACSYLKNEVLLKGTRDVRAERPVMRAAEKEECGL